MTHVFEKIGKYLLALSFFVPLIVVPSSFVFPFIVPKILAFRTIALLLMAVLLILTLHQKDRFMIKLTPITIGVLLFVASFTISTFTGVDWYRSFWDNHERMLGLFTLIHYVFFYVAATTILQRRKDWQDMFRFFLLAGSVVMFIALCQKINPELLLNNKADRVSATLGNAIYLSGYGLFLLFLGIYASIKESVKGWKYVELGVSLLGFLGIFFGGTRGTLLGLIAGIIVIGLGYLLFGKAEEHRRYKQISLYALVGLILIIAGLLPFRQTEVVKSIPAVGRLVSINLEKLPRNTRIMAWQTGIESAKDHLFFGWGPNNFFYAFNLHYKAEFLQHGSAETWFDNAHNVIVNTLTTQGLFGLFVYLSLFGLAIRSLFSSYRQGTLSIHEFLLLNGFLAAHFIHNIFVFENPTSYLYFMFMLAYMNAAYSKETSNHTKSTAFVSTPAMVLIGLVTLGFIVVTNIRPAQANMTTLKAIQSIARQPVLSLAFYEEAKTKGSPHIDDIYMDYARNALQRMPDLAGHNQLEILHQIHDATLADIDKVLAIHPLDIRAIMLKAQLLQVKATLEQDPVYLQQAVDTLAVAQELSPERQHLDYIVANIFLVGGQPEGAENILLQAIAKDPQSAESWMQLIELYVRTEQKEKALQAIADAKSQSIIKKVHTNRILAIEKMYANTSSTEQ